MTEEDLSRGKEIEDTSLDPQELGRQSRSAIERIREQFASLRSRRLGRTEGLGSAEPAEPYEQA